MTGVFNISFGEWLLKQVHRSSPLGEIARYYRSNMANEEHWDILSKSYSTLSMENRMALKNAKRQHRDFIRKKNKAAS